MANNNTSLTPLSSSEKKHLIEQISSTYGIEITELKPYSFYINSKGKIHISNIDTRTIDLDRVNSCGLYFGTVHDGDRFRPSIEGAQIINPKQNTVELTEKSLQSYISGENIFEEEVKSWDKSEPCPFYIVTFENQFLGSMSYRGGIFTNYVSKGRKLDYNKLF